MAGTIRPNDINVTTTPTLSNNPLPTLSSLQTDVAKKPAAPRTPRVDVEPLYAAVKGAITDAEWTTYKTCLSSFLLGNLNQEELSFRLSKILSTPALEHAHNALFVAIYANIWRDPPEAGIASWVSSSDKPSSGAIKGTGDESEKRLKYEVMQLSRRERKRLKTITAGEGAAPGADGAFAGVGALGPVQEHIDARRMKQLEVGPSGIQAGGFGKTSTCFSSSSLPRMRLYLHLSQIGILKFANVTLLPSMSKLTSSPLQQQFPIASSPYATNSVFHKGILQIVQIILTLLQKHI